MTRCLLLTALVSGVGAGILLADSMDWRARVNWATPKVVTPGEGTSAPSDATVLFDGTSLDAWNGNWKIEEGAATPVHGDLTTKKAYGDCQLHLEFATPAKVESKGQGRGNSGVFLAGAFELQILDSYNNETYVEGQCASFYKQRPPLVNACRKPGEWQTYDIVFRAPKFNPDGSLKKPATVTVLHNNVLVQDHLELLGDTPFVREPRYSPSFEKGPIRLQDHGNPIRFRNIWIREI